MQTQTTNLQQHLSAETWVKVSGTKHYSYGSFENILEEF